jgi:hypothetical protein
VQAGQAALVPEIPPRVAGQIAGRQPRLRQLARANRQPAEQLDVHEALPPAALDQTARHKSANREVRVQTVPAWMPLRHPHIRERPIAEALAQPAEEGGQIRS